MCLYVYIHIERDRGLYVNVFHIHRKIQTCTETFDSYEAASGQGVKYPKWEFPRIRGAQCGLQIAGLLFSWHPQNAPPKFTETAKCQESTQPHNHDSRIWRPHGTFDLYASFGLLMVLRRVRSLRAARSGCSLIYCRALKNCQCSGLMI